MRLKEKYAPSVNSRIAQKRIIVSAYQHLATSLLLVTLNTIAGLLSDWKLRVITAASYEDFDAGDIDLSIRFGSGNWPGFMIVHLFAEEGFPICAPALLDRHPELMNASPRTLMKFPLLRLASEGTIGLKWSDWLRDQGETLPIVTGPVFPTFALLLLELVAERGVALGYRHILDQQMLDKRKRSDKLAFTHSYRLAKANPSSMSVKRAKPRHMTVLPGGGSWARAR